MVDLPLVHASRPPEESSENAPAAVLLHGRGGDEHNTIGIEDTLPADLLADAGLDVTFRTYPVGHRMVAEEFADVSEWLGPRR